MPIMIDLVLNSWPIMMGISVVVVLSAVTLAVHEGGHALAAWAFRRKVHMAARFTGPPHAWGVGIHHDGPCLSKLQQVIVTAAGPTANSLVGALAYGMGFELMGFFQVGNAILNLLAPIKQADGYRLVAALYEAWVRS